MADKTNWKERAEAAEKLLKSIKVDVDSMTSDQELEDETLLGGFSVGMQDYDTDEYYISWPNLEFMMGKVNEHFEKYGIS